MSNKSSSNELSSERITSRLRSNKRDSRNKRDSHNKHDSDEKSVEAHLQLRHQRPGHVNESRPSQVPKHSITKASMRISVGYNILQLK